jgi:hypothetical protein
MSKPGAYEKLEAMARGGAILELVREVLVLLRDEIQSRQV